jgi:hypothetical protein
VLDAIRVADEVVACYGGETEPALASLVAVAILDKGIALAAISRRHAAVAVFDELVERCWDSPDPSTREVTAGAARQGGRAAGSR